MGGSEIHAHGARGEKSTSMLFSHVQQKEGSFTSEKEEQKEVDVDSPALAASLFLSGAMRACDRAALLPNRSSAGAIIVANESAQESLSDSYECGQTKNSRVGVLRVWLVWEKSLSRPQNFEHSTRSMGNACKKESGLVRLTLISRSTLLHHFNHGGLPAWLVANLLRRTQLQRLACAKSNLKIHCDLKFRIDADRWFQVQGKPKSIPSKRPLYRML